MPERADHHPDMAVVRAFHNTGLMESVEKTAEAFKDGGTVWPVSYAFMPDELNSLFVL
ncbi:MAG: hypothetical protein LBJ12_09995 [Oscillospiraceae bacterium]|nr:hypothetical protein [Oscillospiraceae bacterium]